MIVSIFTRTKNNEATLQSWISWYKQHCPIAGIYIYDEDSTDKTLEIAEENKCIIRQYKHRFIDIDDWKNNCWKHVPTDCVVLAEQDEYIDIHFNLFKNCSVVQAKGFNIEDLKHGFDGLDEFQKRNSDLDKYCIFDAGSIRDMNFEKDSCNPVGVFKVGETQANLYRLI